MRTLGIVLLALGLLSLIYSGFTYSHTKKAIDAGPIQVDVKENEHVRIPPVAGIVAVLAGTILLVTGSRRRLA